MRVETSYQVVTISDIPNAGKLTMVEVNLQDGQVSLTYEGFVPYKPAPTIYVNSTDEAQELVAAVQPPRYDGELDPPNEHRIVRTEHTYPEQADTYGPRRVKDNPQA